VRKVPTLLRLSPSQDLVFSPNSYGDLTARIQMSNVSPGAVAYKMKTTTPERFKVRPSSGLLSPGQSSMMDIAVAKSHMNQSGNIVQDKFLISAISVSGQDFAPEVINAQLKSSKPDAQYRFRCLLSTDKTGAGAGAKSNGAAVGSGPDMTEVKKEATKVNKKLTDLSEKMDNLEMQIKMIFYVGIGMLSLNILMIIGDVFF